MGSVGRLMGGDITGLFGKMPSAPVAPALPPPVEEVDVDATEELVRKRAMERKGRQSTILASLGSTNQGKKTVLG